MIMNLISTVNDESTTSMEHDHHRQQQQEEEALLLTPNEIRRTTGYNPRPIRDRNNFSPDAIRKRTGYNPTLGRDRPPPPSIHGGSGSAPRGVRAADARNGNTIHHRRRHHRDPPNMDEEGISALTLDDRLGVSTVETTRNDTHNNIDDNIDDNGTDNHEEVDSVFPSLDERFAEPANSEEVQVLHHNLHENDDGSSFPSLDDRFVVRTSVTSRGSKGTSTCRRDSSSNNNDNDNEMMIKNVNGDAPDDEEPSTHVSVAHDSSVAAVLTGEVSSHFSVVHDSATSIAPSTATGEGSVFYQQRSNDQINDDDDDDDDDNNKRVDVKEVSRRYAQPVHEGGHCYNYNRAPSVGSLPPLPPRYHNQSDRMILTKRSSGNSNNNDDDDDDVSTNSIGNQNNDGHDPNNNSTDQKLETMTKHQDDEAIRVTAPEARCYPPPHPLETSTPLPLLSQQVPTTDVANHRESLEASHRAVSTRTLVGGSDDSNVTKCMDQHENNEESTHYTAPEPKYYPPLPPPFLQDPPIQPPPRPPTSRVHLPPPPPPPFPVGHTSVGHTEATAVRECDFYHSTTTLGVLIQTFRYREARQRLESIGSTEAAIWIVIRRQDGKDDNDLAINNDDKESNKDSYTYRRLPLHMATDALSSSAVVDNASLRTELEGLIDRLLFSHPKGCSERDHEGNLPLHYAVRSNATPETISNLLVAYPKSNQEKDSNGEYPLALSEANYNNRTVNKLLRLGHDFWVKAVFEAHLRLKHRHIPHPEDSVASMSVLAAHADGFGHDVIQDNSFDNDTLATMDEFSLVGQQSVENSYFGHGTTFGPNDIYFEPTTAKLGRISEEDRGLKAKNAMRALTGIQSERLATIFPQLCTKGSKMSP